MKKRIHIAFVATAMVAIGSVPAQAQNLLTNGEFEAAGGVEAPGWMLEEFATGSGTILNAAQVQEATWAAISGEWGLWLQPFVGGEESGPDNLTNGILSQTVPGMAGETYTFSGWSKWETNYSGSVDFLSGGPLDGQASPTQTNMELAFLDAGGSVIGTPVMLDLRTEQDNFGFPVQHTLMGQAPAGTASVRVTAEGRDMVYNTDPAQSAFYDDFSLTGAAAPGTELLTNPDLEEAVPPTSPLDNWIVTAYDPEGLADDDIVVSGPDYANHTSGGANGVFLKSFHGDVANPVDGMLSQTVPGVEGGDYTFSGWSRWETNYSGGLAEVETETFMELAFLDGSDAVIGDPVLLDLRDEQMNDGAWRQHALNGVAPTGTAGVRVSAGMIGGVNSETNPQSAFFDDFVLELASAFDADFNDDGRVDGDDFLIWQGGFGGFDGNATKMDGDANTDGFVDGDDFLVWQTEFGSGDGAGSAAVPEPASALLALLAAGLLAIARRRST